MNPLRWLSSLLRTEQQPRKTESFYGLDHAILNVPFPPPSMWMNMGYWESTTDFPTACAALLDQVLITAGLLDAKDGGGGPVSHPPNKVFRMLDVGIGCGDQSVRVLGYKRRGKSNGTGTRTGTGTEGRKGDQEGLRPLFEEYVGITSLPVQAEFAARRVALFQEGDEGAVCSGFDEKEGSEGAEPKSRAQIFCADAAKPSSWGAEIHASLETYKYTRRDDSPDSADDPLTEENNQPQPSTDRSSQPEDKPESETYLLALDTLYHFTPSRTPLLTYTKHSLNSTLLAFDLLLPSTPLPLLTRLCLRLLCLLTGTPYSNFLTESQYRSLLINAGYEAASIEFHDISAHVFPGIARFMARRVREARMFGMGRGVGKYRGAGKVFAWWATGVVRGVVVVARA
ncbi:hypothetical protein BJX64DRAFT_206308 [Aspergillus heterothallicus]